ncbi:NineTeen Complex (NTC) component [Cichlidogyrus casuarinus]|uniref:NineTeen Complex (NTC) component n=1 Tax=Cichlidogyrus casuarinus TaxID=1844966 RepID=A0ABD2QH46_9PLAT
MVASLGEYKIRDLNDEINKLIREKSHWEKRIKELGGPDYAADAPKLLEKDGREAPGYRGYRYFGAARDLPGVRELFEEEPQPPPRKTRGELMKNVDISYYGNCDEDDGVILPQEAEYEKQMIRQKIKSYQKRRIEEKSGVHRLHKKLIDNEQDVDDIHQDDQNIYDAGSNPVDEELMRLYADFEPDKKEKKDKETDKIYSLLSTVDEDLAACSASSNSAKPITKLPNSLPHAFVAHVPVKSQAEMEELLVEQRKKQLMSQYMSEDLLATVSQTSALLGHNETTEKKKNDDKPREFSANLEDAPLLTGSKRSASSAGIDPHEAASHHPLYNDSADEDEDNDEDFEDE